MDVDVDTLERVMAAGWRALESDALGDWLRRASGGFTSRGNSVLAVGTPGCSLAVAVRRVESWYAARGLPAVFAVAEGASGAGELTKVLTAGGYDPRSPTVAYVADTALLAADRRVDTAVSGQDTLTPDWMRAFAAYRPVRPVPARAMLTGSDAQVFLSTHGPDGGITGIARVSLDEGWAGIHAMWVEGACRRRGLATALVTAAATTASDEGAGRVYLLVEAANAGARALYERHGFAEHHTYRYFARP